MNVKNVTRKTKIGQVSAARSPATKSPFLLMTNQNTTSPALHHQNQPPDSGSVHESQRRQLRLSLHRSHRNTCCVCFCFRVFYNFQGEKRRSLYCSSSSHQKSVSVVVVVVVFTLTDRASTIPSNIRGCQPGTWSQRGTKVNGSHHGDNPLLRPTGIQIATKSHATLQAMAPTNSKTVHQTSFTPYREQPRSTRIVVAYPRQAFSATNRTNTFQPVLMQQFHVSQGYTSYKK